MPNKKNFTKFVTNSHGQKVKLGNFLEGLYLNNFKSFFNQEITQVKFAPRITLLFGKNSSGKSSIIHALKLIEQSNKNANDLFLNPPDNDPGGLKFIDLKSILSNGSFSNDLVLGVRSRTCHINSDLPNQDPEEDIKSIIKKYNFKKNKVNSITCDYYSHNEEKNLENEKFVTLENSAFNFYDIKNYYTSKITFINNKFSWRELFKYAKVHKAELQKRLKECKDFDDQLVKLIEKDEISEDEKRKKVQDAFDDAKKPTYVFTPLIFNFPKGKTRTKTYKSHSDLLSKIKNINYEEFIDYIASDIKLQKKYFYKDSKLYDEEEMYRNLRSLHDSRYDSEIRRVTWDGGYSFSSFANFLCWNLTQLCGGERPGVFGFDPNSKNPDEKYKTLEPKDMVDLCKNRVDDTLSRVLIFQGQKPLPVKFEVSEATPNFIGYDYSNLASVIKSHSSEIDKWIKHFGYDFKVKAETSGVMGDSYIFHKKNNTKINYKMGGLGAENILPVIAQSVAAEEKIIVLEEPERRAHPGLQAKMADLFVDCSVKNQFIIETHSENLLLGILKKIRDGEISHRDVQISYVYIKNGQSQIDELEINEQGRFGSSWRDGFFNERLDLL